MPDPHSEISSEEREALAIQVGAKPSEKPSLDVRSNFPMWHKLSGSRSYRKKLTNAAEALYRMLRQNENIQAHFDKQVHLKERKRARLNALPERCTTPYRFALEILLHSLAYALSSPLTKDEEGRETRRNYVAVPLDNNAFSKPPYNVLKRDAFRSMVYALAIFDPEDRGRPWLEYVPGFTNPVPGEGRRTCVRAETPFQEWMFGQGLIFPYHPKGPSSAKAQATKKAKQSLLWVSRKEKQRGETTSSVTLERPLIGEEIALPAINTALSKQQISFSFSSYAEYLKYYDHKNGRPKIALGGSKALYRQFAGADGRGGRLYGHWVQTMPSELRRRLRINRNAVSELDFRNMQMVLLYGMAGVPVPEADLYSQPSMTSSREDMKMVLTLSVGNATRQKTEEAIRGRLHEEGRLKPGRAERLYDEFWSAYIAVNPHNDDREDAPWIELQSLDSRIALCILAKLLDHGITAIPVHDSFIVERQHTEWTKSMMLKVFNEYCPNTSVQVKVTGDSA